MCTNLHVMTHAHFNSYFCIFSASGESVNMATNLKVQDKDEDDSRSIADSAIGTSSVISGGTFTAGTKFSEVRGQIHYIMFPL